MRFLAWSGWLLGDLNTAYDRRSGWGSGLLFFGRFVAKQFAESVEHGGADSGGGLTPCKQCSNTRPRAQVHGGIEPHF